MLSAIIDTGINIYEMANNLFGEKKIVEINNGGELFMTKDLLQEIGCELGDKTRGTLLETLINCFIDNPIDFGKNIAELMKQTKSIPDMILWNNFYLFLKDGNFDYDILRKLSERLEESGNQQEVATCIVYAINRVDDPRKAKYISWLTLSLINQQIEIDNYFRLIKSVENLVYADLIYLAENVENVRVDLECSKIDDFFANGLIYNVDGGYAYADKAYDLIEFGIRRGHRIRRPSQKSERQILAITTDEDIAALFNEQIDN